ncbi:MAG: hypothetical protein EBZ48_13410 [Proteobacteria bacterium]|nr:hypothetical protein [Pseudomonadota bacterium]
MAPKSWSYEEVFNVEIDGWCYGIENYPGEFYPNLVHLIIREMKPMLKGVLEKGVVFNIVGIAEKMAKASKYRVHEKELAFSILAQLPNPSELSEDGQYAMAQVLDKVEQVYEGVLERLERRWSADKRQVA